MKKEEKTNVMRLLDSSKIEYLSHSYDADPSLSGEEIAGILGEECDKVFKTLVTVGKTGTHYVFVIPVNAELDLKKVAKVSGEKSIEMIKQKELLPLTGYVHGGCSPVGMKKHFATFFHETAILYDRIYVSAGKVGCQVELNPEELIKIVNAKTADLVKS